MSFISGLLGGGSKPKKISPPPLPAPQPVPQDVDVAVQRAKEDERKRRAVAFGRQSTILTGPTLGEGLTQRKTLLGA